MRLAIGRTRESPGFTLLEILTVMALIALLTAGAARSLADSDGSLRYETAGNQLSAFARRAHREAAVSGVTHEILFVAEGFGLLPSGAEGDWNEGMASHELASDIGMEMLGWGMDEWAPIEGYRWSFPAYGLSEPLTIRFRGEDGGLEMILDPLGGAIVEMRSI